jgi:hypothetical protein
MPSLRELQAAFARSMLDPGPPTAPAEAVLGAGLPPTARLAIYRNNVMRSLETLLAGTFPATRHRLGPERFGRLSAAFIRQAPPDRPQLLAYGAGFPAFLAETGEAAALDVDLARLEWAREEAYHAADAPLLDPARLAAIPPERYPDLAFTLHPAVRWLAAEGPVHAAWLAARDEAATLAEEGPEQVLIARPAMTVTTRAITLGDLRLVEALSQGLPLGEAAALALLAEPELDLQAALARHLTGGSFTACREA